MKRFLPLLLCLLLCKLASAQLTTEDSVGITRERWRDSTFRMNMQYVPTGILLEYSLFPFEASKYDGLNSDDDTLKFNGQLYMLHNILKDGIVNTNANLSPTDTLFAKAFWHNRNTGNIPFTLIYQVYNRIRQSALSEGLFAIANDSVGILDVLPRSTSPYDSFYAFFAAPFITSITQFNAIPFSFPDTIWQMPGINSILINFDDGAGYRTVTKNSTLNIYYATEGLKLITIQINTSGGTRTAKCQIDYKRPKTWSPPSMTWNFEVDPVYTDDVNYLGQARIQDGSLFDCGGTLLQQLLCNAKVGARVETENGCDNIFDKPVIIVEGFDPDGTLTIDELKDRFGSTLSYPFRQILKAYGYDFVYVDFTKNGDYIENNAKVLEAVINKVNQEKVGNFESTVIGFSMGGLIARWCLKDMEDRGLQHHVENYFSYDAPHQGANIPLGMQYLFKEIEFDLPYLRWFNIGGFRDLSKANNSPAARQMLITKPIYTGFGNSTPSSQTLTDLRAAFAQRLVAKGYPQQTTNYGISFGRGNNTASTKDAGNGIQWNNFGPGTQIFKGNMTWFLINFQTKGYAVQENNTNDYIAKYRFEGVTIRTIFGFIPTIGVTLRIRNFKYTGQFPYDDAPGGYVKTQAEFAASLSGWANGAAADATTFDHDGHNFVTVASALDLQNQNYASGNNWQSSNMFFNIDNFIQNPGTVTGNTLSNPTLSPFTAVITSTSNSFGVNLFHNADISSANALFIIRKILNANPNFSCLTDGFCGANPSINGTEVVCSTANYQLTNFPNGIKIIWSSVNGKFNITSGQGTPNITISKITDGLDILRVIITNACGASLSFEKNITIGIINPGPINWTWNVPPNRVTLDVDDVPGATSYKWYLDGVLKATTTNSYYQLPMNGNVSCGNFYYFGVKAVNGCGTSEESYVGAEMPPCDFAYSVSPNPSSGSINIIANEDNTSQSNTNRLFEIREVEIYDKMGILKQKQKFAKGITSVNVSVAALPSDFYNLRIFDGQNWHTYKIIVQH